MDQINWVRALMNFYAHYLLFYKFVSQANLDDEQVSSTL